jgi:hypothetical protein
MSFVADNALPPSLTARIIVQRSKEIFDEKLLWRKGAVLKCKGSTDTIACIIEESRSITVSVKGTEKTAYIASLRETIKVIFEDYKVIKPDLLYEVLFPEGLEKSELPPQLKKEKPLMLSEEVIIGCLQAMRPYFDAPNMREISLDVTEKGYKLLIKTKETEEMQETIRTHDNSPVVINSPGAIVGSNVNQNLPAPEEQFNQILEMLEKFLESEQAGEIPTKGTRALKAKIDETRKLGFKEGWERLRGFLSDGANIATIGTAISAFLTAHPEIPEAIRLLLTR